MRMKKTYVTRLLWIGVVFGVLCFWQFTVPAKMRFRLPTFGYDPDHPEPMSVDTRSLHLVERVYQHVFNPTTDPQTCANALTSKFQLNTQNNKFRLGEMILVNIQLFDSYERRKTTGGDFVRVWMKEDGKDARVAGNITDHNNGSYTGCLQALWTGTPEIYVAIASPRERMEILYRIYRDHYSLLHYFTGVFESDGIEEETECLPIPDIPGYIHVCNLTSENYGLPWYCGKPPHQKLLCHDFTGIHQKEGQPLRFTQHEEKFFNLRTIHQKLPGSIKIEVTAASDKETVTLPRVPCNKSPPRHSWEASTPVGFFYKNQWKSLTCNNTVPTDPQTYRKCLRNRTLWIHGDSTSRQWFVNFNSRLKMELMTEPWNVDKWHKPAVLRDEQWNITLMFVPHEYPFYHGANKLAYNRATHAYLDGLPSDSTDMFVIHLYLHFNPTPPDLYRSHIRRIAKSVKSLVSRAPRVKIAIRGTHAFKGAGRIGFLNDCWMLVHDRIIREEFRGLVDKVLYLNNIDLTIATENDDAHPNKLALDSLIEHFMGHVCTRDV